MKKQTLSLLLCFTLLLSMSACASKETTGKKEFSIEPKQTTETTMTTTTTASETEETSSSTSETSAVPQDGENEVTISSDLQMLEFSNDPASRATGWWIDGNYDRSFINVDYFCDQYHLLTDGYEPLRAKIDDISAVNLSICELFFEDSLSQAQSIDWLERFEIRMRFARADERVCSYKVETSGDDSSLFYYTLDALTAEPISLDQVITDRLGFANALYTYLAPTFEDTSTLSLVVKSLEAGEEMPFLLYPNCIVLCFDNVELAVSAYSFASYIDMSYFTSTTPYYSLYSDSNRTIQWDIDADGRLDNISIHIEEDELTYSTKTLIVLNDQTFIFTSEYAYQNIDHFYLTQTDNGFYLYTVTGYEDGYYDTEIYHFENNAFVYVEEVPMIESFPYNPEDCITSPWGDLMGTGTYLKNSTLIGTNGIPTIQSNYIFKRNIKNCACTAKDLTVKACDKEGQSAGQDMTVPEGTLVRLVKIDASKNVAIMATIDQDGHDQDFFQIGVVDNEEYDLYDFFYQDQKYDYASQQDLFAGIAYGG